MAENEINVEQMETDIFSALVEAAEFRPDKYFGDGEKGIMTLRVKRRDKILFTFDVQAITEDQLAKCRRQNLKNRGKRTEELDDARFGSQIIFEATVDADKKKFWQHKQAWKKFNVTNGTDLIKEILTPAERNKAVEEIFKLSGYDDDLEDMVKK